MAEEIKKETAPEAAPVSPAPAYTVQLPDGTTIACSSIEELQALLGQKNEAERELDAIEQQIGDVESPVTISVEKGGHKASRTIRPATLDDITDAHHRCASRWAEAKARILNGRW